MSIFIKELVKNKLKQLSSEELIYYGKQYGFSLSKTEAEHIVTYLRQHNLDPFDVSDQEKMFHALATITSTQTANKAQKIFKQIIQSYGLDHLFK